MSLSLAPIPPLDARAATVVSGTAISSSIDELIASLSLQIQDIRRIGAEAWLDGDAELGEWARERLAELEGIGVQLQLLRAQLVLPPVGDAPDGDDFRRGSAERAPLESAQPVRRLSLRPQPRRRRTTAGRTPNPWWLSEVVRPKEWEGEWYDSVPAEIVAVGIQTGPCPHCGEHVDLDLHPWNRTVDEPCLCRESRARPISFPLDAVRGDPVLAICPKCGRHVSEALSFSINDEAPCPECDRTIFARFFRYDAKTEDFIETRQPRWFAANPD